MKKKIVLTLGGGLGNQMFEYSFARSLQFYIGGEIVLNLYHVKQYKNNDLRLQHLNISNIKTCNYIQTYYYRGLQYLKWYILNIFLNQRNISDEKKYDIMAKYGIVIAPRTYWGTIPDTVRGNKIMVYGTFQSYKSCELLGKQLKSELRVKTAPTKQNEAVLDKISKYNSVCVHIRRGDYIEDKRWSNLNICNYDYYREAFLYISKKVKDPVFFIFSNNSEDIKWIKDNYDFSEYCVEYVDLNNPDYEELRLMYSCKHFIISNSSFSWWGQYLSMNQNKVVVAPSLWHKTNDASQIYMDSWHIISV